MKIILIFISLFFIVSLNEIYTQDITKGEIGDKQNYTKFLVKPKYPVNVAFCYKKTTNTKVTQFFSDSSKRSFQRNVDLFFTFYSPEKAENGITLLKVTIDSLIYKFNTGIDSVYYDTQNDEMSPPFKYEDYEASSVVLGKSFNFSYSPYWDFGKIDGPDLAEKREYINNPLDGIKDSIRNYFWNYRLSDKYLTDIVDILKNLIPSTPIDTSMNRRIRFNWDAEEISFVDTNATAKLISTTSQGHTLKATMNKLYSERKNVRIFGFGKFVDLIQSSGTGEYELEISPQGRVDIANGSFKFELLFRDRNETIKEVIEQNVIYQLLKNYKI